MINRAQRVFSQFSRFLMTAVLVTTVACDPVPTALPPPSQRAQPPQPPRPGNPQEPARSVEQDAAKTTGHSGVLKKPSPGTKPPGRETNRESQAPSVPQRAPVALSAGVALPQSLPTGTAMGFSVDYVVSGTLPTSGQVVWVVEAAAGGGAQFPVRLESRGNLMNFAPQLRPEHGPFQSYLIIASAGGDTTPISPKVPMRAP